MDRTPALVMARNHSRWALRAINQVWEIGLRPVLVDMGSTSSGMKNCIDESRQNNIPVVEIRGDFAGLDPTRVLMAHDTRGENAIFDYILNDILNYNGDRFVVTSGYLDMQVRENFIDVLHRVLDENDRDFAVGPHLDWMDHTKPWDRYEFLGHIERADRAEDQCRFAAFSVGEENSESEETIVCRRRPVVSPFSLFDRTREWASPDGPGIRVEFGNSTVFCEPWYTPLGDVLKDDETLNYIMTYNGYSEHWTKLMRIHIINLVKKINDHFDDRDRVSGRPEWTSPPGGRRFLFGEKPLVVL